MVSLEKIRKQYQINELNRKDLLESPTEMFRSWFEKIADLKEKYSEKKKQLEQDREVGEKKRQAEHSRREASALHREMIRLADEAQLEHNKMIECSNKEELADLEKRFKSDIKSRIDSKN